MLTEADLTAIQRRANCVDMRGDKEFIAHACYDIQRLIDTVRALRDERDRYKAEMETWQEGGEP